MQKSKSIVTKIIHTYALIILIGAFCVVLIDRIGFGLPCLFHLITGLKCPGCGNTTAVMCIFSLDFKSAYDANKILPLEVVYLGYFIYRFTKAFYIFGKPTLNIEVSKLDIVFLVIFLIWGFVRNILNI